MEKKLLEEATKLLQTMRAEIETKLLNEIDPDSTIPTNKWFALQGESIGLSEAISILLQAQIEEIKE